MAEIQEWLGRGVEIPECESCGGILKDEGIAFGEPMPVKETREAERRSRQCDLCIVIGSSLAVYPAAYMPMYALQSGARLVIINEGDTPLDGAAHVRIRHTAGEVLAEVLKRVKERLAA